MNIPTMENKRVSSWSKTYSCILVFIPTFRIIDTAGQEDYEALRKYAYAGTDLLIIAFDITRRESFDNVKEKWIKDQKSFITNAKVNIVSCHGLS